MKTHWLRVLVWWFLAALIYPQAVAQQASPNNTPLYLNPNLAIPDRVADLLPRMTLEEKVEQLAGGESKQFSIVDPTGTFTEETARRHRIRAHAGSWKIRVRNR